MTSPCLVPEDCVHFQPASVHSEALPRANLPTIIDPKHPYVGRFKAKVHWGG